MKRKPGFWKNNFTIKTKLILCFVLVSIIPILILAIVSLNISNNIMLERSVQDSLTRLAFIDYRANEIIKSTHKSAVLFAYDDDVRTYSEIGGTQTEEELFLIRDKVARQIKSLYSVHNVSSILFTSKEGQALYYSHEQYSSVREIYAPDKVPRNTDAYAIFDLWDNAAWDGSDPVIPYNRIILGKESNQAAAYLTVNIKENVFHSLYRAYEVERGTECFIVNQNGIIQSCTDKSKFALRMEDALGFTPDMFCDSSGFFQHKDSVVTYTYNAQQGLYFVESTPLGLINKGFHPTLIMTLMLVVLCVFICVLLGYLLSWGFTRPIYSLIDKLGTFGGGDGGPSANSKNEFIILHDKYEDMIQYLEIIIDEYYEEQKKKKEAQIRALEFQINPHFLYNTLSTIIWLIEKAKYKKAIHITKDLSAFFRISISKGREYITIKEELTHSKLYINIQKTRYEGQISVEYDVSDQIFGYYTPKLILQPLLENSIQHAMQITPDKMIRIKIIGRLSGGDIILEVWDNGETSGDTIDEMNQFLMTKRLPPQTDNRKQYGIGIANVHDRVTMCFGSRYGLRYRRENNETVASIRIKAITRGDEGVSLIGDRG